MADANTPDWLQESNAPAPTPIPVAPGGITDSIAPPAPPQQQQKVSNATAGTNASAAASVEDDADLPSIILTMRLANMGVSIALIATSVRWNFVGVTVLNCCVP